jgi:predicted nucleic acid-binding protein
MKPVFADTGFWIALLNPRDRWHSQAISLDLQLQEQRRKIVSSEMVLTEVLNFFSKFTPLIRQSTALLVQEMRSYPNIILISQDSSQFQHALSLYSQRLDKAWSLTDCNSFLIMQELELTEALAHDKHFQQAGFLTLLTENL